jgi:6-phosphogluconolactonase/glucosamine-6-phosphate isomerase/deaminase
VARSEGPASITLSLPVMNAAAHSVIAMTGEKKAPAVKKALEEKGYTMEDFLGDDWDK